VSTQVGRRAALERATKETTIAIDLNLDGTGQCDISTGIPFFDHMLDQLGRHGAMDLTISATGDLRVDTHHTVEDVGILLGECVREALGDKAGIERFASRVIPLDEAAVDITLDISGRPFLIYEIVFAPDTPGLGEPAFDPQLVEEFFRAFVTAAGMTLHIRLVSGRNTHHIVEATFKGVARCLKDAMTQRGGEIPSTKGSL
jgi:imidazoleglycerol-phosphate dehydratase